MIAKNKSSNKINSIRIKVIKRQEAFVLVLIVSHDIIIDGGVSSAAGAGEV